MRRTGGGWNKGVKVGKKQPFTPEQVQMIRAALKARGDLQGLALFEFSMSVMLRASDLLNLRIGDVWRHGCVVDDIELQQRKTKGGVKVSVSERAKAAVGAMLLQDTSLLPERRLWAHNGRPYTRKRYAEAVKSWARLAYADPARYATHSMRRTLAKHIYNETHDHETVRQLLGHASIASTSTYLDVERDAALAKKRKFEL